MSCRSAGGSNGGQSLERAIKHVKENSERVAGGGIARGDVERAEYCVSDLPVDESVGDGQELRDDRQVRSRYQVEVAEWLATHLRKAPGAAGAAAQKGGGLGWVATGRGRAVRAAEPTS